MILQECIPLSPKEGDSNLKNGDSSLHHGDPSLQLGLSSLQHDVSMYSLQQLQLHAASRVRQHFKTRDRCRESEGEKTSPVLSRCNL
jgi:hypothetical protein